jgi:rare lipoprotein A
LSRPHITGRALRAHLTPFALSSIGVAALTLVPAGSAAGTQARPSSRSASLPGIPVAPGDPSGQATPTVPATPAVSGISATPIGLAGGPFATPARVRMKLRIRHLALSVLEGSAATIAGTLRPARAGRTVELQRKGTRGWQTVARAHTRARGAFVLRYAPHRLLTERVRVLFPGDTTHARVQRRVGLLRVYRLAGASWYGGGGSLACGGWLTSATMGVANRTLPCGTFVTLRYGGHTVRVPVVDRGPYVAGREFDLTEATKRALGFEGVGEVWSSR